MTDIIVGIDPDSDKHGVAVFVNGTLSMIKSLPLVEIVQLLGKWKEDGLIPIFAIENVKGISNSQFHWKNKDPLAVKAKKSEHVGMCKQSQKELERFIELHGFKIVHYRVSRHWKKDRKLFEYATGWTGQSNEDTRSAAYFGYQETKR